MNHDMELSLAVAVLAGVLMGLERQTAVARDVAGGTGLDIGGVRTCCNSPWADACGPCCLPGAVMV